MSYYDILGLPSTASDEEIKREFRRLAKELHPDVNKAADASERFQLVRIAYDVLSDPWKRALYDALQNQAADEEIELGPAHRDPAYRRNAAYRKQAAEGIADEFRNSEAWHPHWYYTTVVIVGLFVGLLPIAFFAMQTFIRYHELVLAWLAIAGLFYLLHLKVLRSKRHPVELRMTALLGYGPLFLAVFLCVNYFVHFQPHHEVATVHFDRVKGGYRNRLVSDDPLFSSYPGWIVSATNVGGITGIGGDLKLHLSVARGIFGFRVILQSELEQPEVR